MNMRNLIENLGSCLFAHHRKTTLQNTETLSIYRKANPGSNKKIFGTVFNPKPNPFQIHSTRFHVQHCVRFPAWLILTKVSENIRINKYNIHIDTTLRRKLFICIILNSFASWHFPLSFSWNHYKYLRKMQHRFK